MFGVFCGVDSVSSWEADGPYKIMSGSFTAVRFALFADREVSMGMSVQVTLDDELLGDVEKCGLTDKFLFVEALSLWATGGEIWFIRLAICRFWVESVCSVGVWVGPPSCYSFCSRSAVVGRSAARDVEKNFELSWRLVYQ